MDQATQQNAALVEESAAAAESLKSQAQQLVQAVAVFQLAEGGPPRAAERLAPTTSPAKGAGSGFPTTERRSPNRGKNIKRLPTKASPTSDPTRVATRKTGTDDEWTSF
jgi:methyl-accepting chemotaxis protein